MPCIKIYLDFGVRVIAEQAVRVEFHDAVIIRPSDNHGIDSSLFMWGRQGSGMPFMKGEQTVNEPFYVSYVAQSNFS